MLFAPILLAVTSDEALAKVQQVYDATQDLKASFKQVWESPAQGQSRTAYGYVYLKRPGRMRWNYSKPDRKSIVSDGTTLWVYEEEDAQVFRQDLKEAGLPTAVAFLTGAPGAAKLREQFDAVIEQGSPYGGPDRIVLKLTPKQPTPQYAWMFFVVATADWLVRETIVVDQQDGRNRISFWDIQRNTRIPESRFRFVPPGAVKVVDPSSLTTPP
jgi:outer membrane lipoprotein carrier protein